jgi:uncharacterized protein YjbI with pentapeptide repeats
MLANTIDREAYITAKSFRIHYRFLVWFLPSVLVFLTGLLKGIENGEQKAIELVRRYPVTSLLIMAVVVCLSLWKLPLCHVAGSNLGNDYQRLERINDARKTIAQIWAGVVVLAGLGFTWYRIEVAREGQITERFTRAIDQLGTTGEHGNKRLEIRLGGIYALERIARDSEKDHWPIMEVLTAYVREHAPWKEGSPSQQEQPSAPEAPSSENASQQREPQSQPRPDADIQAILTVIGRRMRRYGKGEDQSLDLHRTDMRRADLSGAHLEGANLSFARIDEAILIDAHLERAYLISTHLNGAILIDAHLERAHLINSHLLEGANLNGAHLERANLSDAHLEKAILIDAHLDGAILYRTHLEGVDLSHTYGLTREQLAVAYTDENTLLPDYLIRTPSQADDEDA